MKDDIMIDIETLDTKPTAVVLSIGAVLFNFEEGVKSEFYVEVATVLQLEAGRTMSASTVDWWNQQSDAAREFALGVRERPHMVTALEALTAFFNDSQGNIDGVWGNGSDFDNVIVSSLYDTAGVPRPWKHHQNRCYRTLRALAPPELALPAFDGTKHHAMHDARHQARCAILMHRAIFGAPGTSGPAVVAAGKQAAPVKAPAGATS